MHDTVIGLLINKVEFGVDIHAKVTGLTHYQSTFAKRVTCVTINLKFFQRTSGRSMRQIGQLPNIVNHLAYSPGGSFLAALGAGNGIRAYDSEVWACSSLLL
jgi:hypothetical protein